jgi:hypothetical protein
MKRISPEQRFWPKVMMLGPDDCWPCLGATKGIEGKKYGNFWIGRPDQPYIGAHCFAWELANGPIPDGYWILHRCDVMLCVNERHLFLGTVNDNNRDMMLKNRVPFGERHWNAKLQEKDIRLIIGRAAAGEMLKAIAADYKVNGSLISQIISGKGWKRAPRMFDEVRELDSLYDAIRTGIVEVPYLRKALGAA